MLKLKKEKIKDYDCEKDMNYSHILLTSGIEIKAKDGFKKNDIFP